jgi:hypothetical protein
VLAVERNATIREIILGPKSFLEELAAAVAKTQNDRIEGVGRWKVLALWLTT